MQEFCKHCGKELNNLTHDFCSEECALYFEWICDMHETEGFSEIEELKM